MRIGIDIDDTITDTYYTVLKYVAEYYNKDYEELKRLNYTYDDFFKSKDFPKFGRFLKENFHKAIPLFKVKENAIDVINKLKADGNEIVIVTARASAKKGQNINFLKENHIPYDEFYEGIWEKGKLAKEEHLDVFIDDSFEHYRQVTSENIKAFLFDAPYNQKFKDYDRVTTWNEVYDKLKEM